MTSNKDKFGEVFTPPHFVQQMYDTLFQILPNFNANHVFEPGAGKGVFFDVFCNTNSSGLFHPSTYVLNEINPQHHKHLIQISSASSINPSILIQDIFNIDMKLHSFQYDLVLGNLPFNSNSRKSVPANSKFSISGNSKTKSTIVSKPKLTSKKPPVFQQSNIAVTLWTSITHFLFNQILKYDGFYYCIIPCIWLKPDKAHIYELFTQTFTIHFIRIFDATTANKIFKYNCQTPVCYVLVQKKYKLTTLHPVFKTDFTSFQIFDNLSNQYTNFNLLRDKCIPTNFVSLFNANLSYLQHVSTQYGIQFPTFKDQFFKISSTKPEVLKQKSVDASSGQLLQLSIVPQQYKIITGAIFDKKNNHLGLNGFVSYSPGAYFGKPKLILPHKRLPQFFKDYDGSFSLYGRDMYVFLCDTPQMIDQLFDFFNLPFIQNIIQFGFRIRMNFIEKYVFEYLPWIFHPQFNLTHYLQFFNP